MGRFACLVADARDPEGSSLCSSSSSSDSEEAAASAVATGTSSAGGGGSSSSAAALSAAVPAPRYGLPPGLPAPIAATQAAAAAEGRVELGPLVGMLVSTFFPESMRQNYAASYAGGGLLGAVVIDTMGEFVPPKKRRMPNGTIRCGFVQCVGRGVGWLLRVLLPMGRVQDMLRKALLLWGLPVHPLLAAQLHPPFACCLAML